VRRERVAEPTVARAAEERATGTTVAWALARAPEASAARATAHGGGHGSEGDDVIEAAAAAMSEAAAAAKSEAATAGMSEAAVAAGGWHGGGDGFSGSGDGVQLVEVPLWRRAEAAREAEMAVSRRRAGGVVVFEGGAAHGRGGGDGGGGDHGGGGGRG